MAQRSSLVPAGRRLGMCLLLSWTIASSLVTRHAGAGGAGGAGEKAECLDAHGDAQLLRRGGKIRAARERLLACSAASCPLLVSRDCTRWLAELDVEQPTIIVAAHDETGRDVGAVRVLVDGELLADELDGRPLAVDPGSHLFRGEFANGRIVESRVIVRANEKSRVVRIDLPAVAPAAPVQTVRPESPQRIPLLAYVLGGIGVASFGSFAYFGISGTKNESSLAAGCRPNCSEDDLADVRRSYLAADISLGVAVVALGAATWIALTAWRAPSGLAQAKPFTLTFE